MKRRHEARAIFSIFILSSLVSVSPVFALKHNPQVTAIKLKAKRELETGHTANADDDYVRGIEQAKRTGDNAGLLELVSALVRERCENKQIKTASSYVDLAIHTVRRLKESRSYDPEISVWMTDLADALYSYGRFLKILT